MRLYFICKNCQNKVYLNSDALTRAQLAAEWGRTFSIPCGKCGMGSDISVKEVFAETSIQSNISTTVTGSLVGYAIGAMLMPLIIPLTPLLIVGGGLAGRFLGNHIEENDESRVDHFNNSSIS